MYPNLYIAAKDLFGFEIPFLKMINSFGLFVALAFITAGFFLKKELIRKTSMGYFLPQETTVLVGAPPSFINITIQSALGFLFGWKFVYLMINANKLFDQLNTPQELLFNFQGNLIYGIVGALLFGGYYYWEINKKRLIEPQTKKVAIQPHEHMGSLLTVAAIGGIVGAKLFHLIEDPESLREFFSQPSLQSFIGGLNIYGGLIIGGLSVAIYARIYNFNFLHLADATAPSLMLAYGVGRIGCQVSGDGDWGKVNNNPKPEILNWIPDWAWKYNFPNNVFNSYYRMSPDGTVREKIARDIKFGEEWTSYASEGFGKVLIEPVYPTSFYETLMAIAIFCILWSLRRRIKTVGVLFSIYLIFNGIERFLIEQIRVNVNFLGLPITQAELISLLLITCGILLFAYLWRNKQTVSATHIPK